MNLSARLRKIAGPRPWGWQELREPSLTEWLAVAEHLELKPNTNTRRMAPQLEAEFGHKGLWSHYGYPDSLQAWIGGPCPSQPPPREGLIDPDELRAYPRYVMLRATHRKQTTDFLCETSDVTDEKDLRPANFGKRGPEDIPLVPKHFFRDWGGDLSGAETVLRRGTEDLIRVTITGGSEGLNEDYRAVRVTLSANAGPLSHMYGTRTTCRVTIRETLWKIFEPQAEDFLRSMSSMGLPYCAKKKPQMINPFSPGAWTMGLLGFYTQQQFEAIEAFASGKDAQALTDRIAYTLRDTLARDPTFTNMLREEPTIPGPPSE